MTYRTCAVSVLLALCAAALPPSARAEYPDHPIRVVLPYAPGAAGDVAMRQIQPLLEKRLGQLPLGAGLVVLATDPMAKVDIPLYCRQNGHDCETGGEDGLLRFSIVKTR